MPTTEIASMPKTVGELVELLSKYPRDQKLNVSIVQDYDGSVYSTESYKLAISDCGESMGLCLTFADGNLLD